jgi:hypothetical protein
LQGRSLKAGEILSKVYMYSAEEEDLAFTLVLDSMIVTEGDLSAKVKAHVRERLGEDYLPWDRVRVREKIECRLGTAMKRGKTLKQTVSALRDGVELALQVVDVRAHPSSNRGGPHSLVFYLNAGGRQGGARRSGDGAGDAPFLPGHDGTQEGRGARAAEGLLSPRAAHGHRYGLRHKLKLCASWQRNANKSACRVVSCGCAGAKYDVPVQFVAVAKPFKHQLGVVSSLLSLNWELYDDAVITKSPLYLRDGDLMLWRDLREIPKEIATDGLPQVYTSSSSFWSLRFHVISSPLGQVVGSVSRPRESGIVIRTVHDLPPGGGEAKEGLLQAEEPATKAADDVATPEPIQ